MPPLCILTFQIAPLSLLGAPKNSGFSGQFCYLVLGGRSRDASRLPAHLYTTLARAYTGEAERILGKSRARSRTPVTSAHMDVQ